VLQKSASKMLALRRAGRFTDHKRFAIAAAKVKTRQKQPNI
jgi:hypothetical protein